MMALVKVFFYYWFRDVRAGDACRLDGGEFTRSGKADYIQWLGTGAAGPREGVNAVRGGDSAF